MYDNGDDGNPIDSAKVDRYWINGKDVDGNSTEDNDIDRDSIDANKDKITGREEDDNPFHLDNIDGDPINTNPMENAATTKNLLPKEKAAGT